MSYLVATDLARSFAFGRKGLFIRRTRFFAVNGVSMHVDKGTTHGIVGESGCGKSTLAKLLLGLIPADQGSVNLDGVPILGVPETAWRSLRQRVQLVYQDAAGALDPRLKIRAQVEEPLAIHGLPKDPAEDALHAVGLSGALADRYPHEMSGGQLQRVVIARALALSPELLVLDEPVSALDVSVGAQIIDLIARIQRENKMSLLIVSHDLSLVRTLVDRVMVVQAGRIVEEGETSELFDMPRHPYSRLLISSVPVAHPRERSPQRLGAI